MEWALFFVSLWILYLIWFCYRLCAQMTYLKYQFRKTAKAQRSYAKKKQQTAFNMFVLLILMLHFYADFCNWFSRVRDIWITTIKTDQNSCFFFQISRRKNTHRPNIGCSTVADYYYVARKPGKSTANCHKLFTQVF